MAQTIYTKEHMNTLLQPVKEFVDGVLSDLIYKISVDYSLDLDELKVRYGLLAPSEQQSEPITPKNQSIPEAIEPPEAPKKKGRKKKGKEEYTEMTKYVYKGEPYLMDKQNNIYTFNVEAPTHIGQKLVNGTIKFFDDNA
jgi:hypothetical protein